MSAAFGSGYNGGQGGDTHPGISVETPGGKPLGGQTWTVSKPPGSTSGNLGGGGKGGSGGGSGPYIPGLKPTKPTGTATPSLNPTAPTAPTTTPAAPKPSTSSPATQPSLSSPSLPGANNTPRYSAPPGSGGFRQVVVQPASSNGTPNTVTVADSAAATIAKPAESAAQQRRDAQLAQPFAPAPSGSYGPRRSSSAPSYLQAQNMPGMYVGDMPAPTWQPTPPPAAAAQPQMVAASMQQPMSPNVEGGLGAQGIAGERPVLFRPSPEHGVTPKQIDAFYNGPKVYFSRNPDAENPFARYANESLPPGYRDAYLNERILGVEDVPVDGTVPGYPAPKPGVGLYGELYGPPSPGVTAPPPGYEFDENPVQYDPKKTWQGRALGTTIDTLLRVAPFGMGNLASAASKQFNQGLTPGQLAQRDLDGYLGASDQQKAAYNARANARRASDTYREGGGNRDALPPSFYSPMLKPTSALAAAAPPPPVVAPPPPPEPDPWALPTRNPNPVDPYSYGYGPGYSYFNYG